MEWAGLGLLILVGVGTIFTGLPAAIVLIAVATLGAILAVASGTVPLALFGALPWRLINLLDNDLLQALPLYVMMGLLLDRLPVADALYRAGLAPLPRGPSGPLGSGMALGAPPPARCTVPDSRGCRAGGRPRWSPAWRSARGLGR